MRHLQTITVYYLLLGICFFIGACSNENPMQMDEEIVDTPSHHKAVLRFDGNVVGFDQQTIKTGVQTKGSNTSWNDGDIVYITFFNGTTIVPGTASYNTATGWSIEYEGELKTGANQNCEVRFFINTTYLSPELVVTNEFTEIYEDINGVFAYDNDTIAVLANLVPKTGRIRFKGTSGTIIYTTGISFYTSYAPGINTFLTDYKVLNSKVASSGYTPYIYGWFKDEDRIIGLISPDDAYTRNCTADMLKTGESGYMAIPTLDAHANWRRGFFVKAGGIEFKMIPVIGHSDGPFLIGETEVTEQLFENVRNGDTSSTSDYPVRNQTGATCINFMSTLNSLTKLNFKLPSREQWKYAARGGNKSLGYDYSGSNNYDDVAWYASNCNGVQKVKQKAPNELGIYDMSGNVCEFINYYESYSDGKYYSYVGGCYADPAIKVTSDSYHSTLSNNGVGFRMILQYSFK